MAKRTVELLPTPKAALKTLGENLRLARLRRNVTARLQAARANISLVTLAKIERGDPSVAMGNYLQVLLALGLAEDVAHVAEADPIGRRLQDLGLSHPGKRARKGSNA